MDLKERNQTLKEFFDRKTVGYDDVHLAFMKSKRALTEVLPDGTAKVLDLGAGKYCRQYFGKERYDLVPAAKYHNAALIDGKGQEFGKHFTAPIAYDARKKTATVSLENAYPESFGIREMSRTIRLKGDSFTVTDTLKRDGNGERVTVVFYSPAASVKQLKSGALVFDKTVTMTLSGATVSSLIREQFPDAVVTRNWGEKLWRIELTVDADASCWEMCFQR